MFSLFSDILEIVILGSSIFLIIAGLSKKEKYSANNHLKKRILIIGIVILVLSVVVGIPEMYNGFVQGFNSARN